jgi:ABC-type transport system substrate-binding protein
VEGFFFLCTVLRRFKYSWFLGACFLWIACGNHQHPDKKIFRYNESSNITSLDPIKATNLPNIWAVQQMYEGLTCIDSLGNVQPLLAETWTANDSLTLYTFTLRNPVYFHTDDCFKGTKKKLTAYDVAFSYQRILASSSAWVLENIWMDTLLKRPAIKVQDSFHLVIRLKRPSLTFPQMLAMPVCAIVPQEAVETYGPDFRRHAVGTGPFYLQAWHENERLILHKFTGYHQTGLPLIDGISISFLKDKQSALLEFIRGNFDFISGLDAAYKDELLMGDGTLNPQYKDQVNLVKSPYLNTEYLGVRLDSTSDSPLQNVHIRKALNYGLDRERLILYIRNGVGVPGHAGFVPPVLMNHQPGVQGYGLNKNNFDQEIVLAGYGSAREVPPIRLYTDVAYTDVCTYIINQWNELGLKVELEVLDRPTLKSEIAKGNVEFFRASWIADYPDPENYLSLFYGPLKSPAGPNYTHFNQQSFNRDYAHILAEKNDSLRNEAFYLLDQEMMNQSPVIILFYDQVLRFTSKRIQNLPPHPMNYLDLKRVTIH